MAEQNKFGQKPDGLRCEEWEALLADALDGLLPAADAAAFKAHSGTCAGCADLLAHAEQGREWLEYLHTEPEAPPWLVAKILDRTTGAGSIPLPVVAGAQGTGVAAMAMPLRRSFQETRLMMTVAMAFFSIALTLNLVGVKVTSLRLSDLRPAVIGSTLSRQFYGARGQVVRYYQNLRFVYQLESRMRELRRDVETTPQPQPTQQKQKNGQSKTDEQKTEGRGTEGHGNDDSGSALWAQDSWRGPQDGGAAAQTVDCAGLDRLKYGRVRQGIIGSHKKAESTTLARTGTSISLGQHRAGQQRRAEHEEGSLA